MSVGTDKLKQAFRLWKTDGVPATGAHEPVKQEIFEAADEIGLDIAAAASGGDPDAVRAVIEPIRDAAIEARDEAIDSAAAISRAISLADTNPNLITRKELAFTDLTRWVNTANLTVGSVNDSPVGIVTAAAGADSSLQELRIPVSALNGATAFAGSFEAVSADAATGGSGAIQLFIRQRTAAGAEISAVRQTIAIAGTGGIAIPATFTFTGTVDPAAAFICIAPRVNATGSSTARSLKFRAMMLASGSETTFRQPPVKPASSSEVLAGTSDTTFVTPAALAAQSVPIVEGALSQIGITAKDFRLLAAAAAIAFPSGLGWDHARFPAYALGSSVSGFGLFAADVLARSAVNVGVWTGPVYYVDPVSGSNSNAGGQSAPVQTMQKAVDLGAAGGIPFRIAPAAGTYPRNRATVTVPAGCPDFAIMGPSARAVLSTHDVLVYTDDGSGTNTYTATRSAVMRVVNRTGLSPRGYYTDLAKRADGDVAGVRANPGSWCQNGSSLVVHRADGAAPTDANTRAYVTSDLFALGSGSTSVYVENIDYEGGNAFHIAGGTRNIAIKGVTSHYGGGSAALYDSFRIVNLNGLFLALNSDGSAACKDAFNFTTNDGTSVAYGLLVGCKGHECGRFGSNSNNGLTAHQPQHHIIDIGGEYRDNVNGDNVAFVGGSKGLMLGTKTSGSDSALNRSGFLADGAGTTLWLQDTTATDTVSLIAAGTGSILKRNHAGAGEERQVTGGTIGAF